MAHLRVMNSVCLSVEKTESKKAMRLVLLMEKSLEYSLAHWMEIQRV